MADIRINALATTAASTASDDYIAIDGSANGTRKLDAYSPTFGGNLTVSGTGRSNFAGNLGVEADNTSGGARLIVRKGSDVGAGAVVAVGLDSLNDAENTVVPLAIRGTPITLVGATTVTSNLTVSGTGTSSVAGYLTIGRTDISSANLGYSNVTYPYAKTDTTLRNVASWSSNETAGSSWKLILTSKGNATAASRFFSLQTSNEGVANNGIFAMQDGGGVVTLGTTTDGGNGILQLATHTTSAGGIGFGTDVSLYRSAVNGLRLNGSGTGDPTFSISNSGTVGFSLLIDGAAAYLTSSGSNGSMYLRTNGGTTALTLDSSQNATFAGAVRSNAQEGFKIAAASGYFAGYEADGTTLNGYLQFINSIGTLLNQSIAGKNIALAIAGTPQLTLTTGNATFAGSIAINNTVQTAASVVSTHKVTISIGGSTYYLLATNV